MDRRYTAEGCPCGDDWCAGCYEPENFDEALSESAEDQILSPEEARAILNEVGGL